MDGTGGLLLVPGLEFLSCFTSTSCVMSGYLLGILLEFGFLLHDLFSAST